MQADLRLCWSHIPNCWKSHDTAQITLQKIVNSVILHAYLSSADIFLKINLFKTSFGNTISVSNSLAPDQARQNVGHDLGSNCMQNLSADNTSI